MYDDQSAGLFTNVHEVWSLFTRRDVGALGLLVVVIG